MKVLLVQLPVPNNRLTNVPLGLGYLKASADALHLPDVEIVILEREVQDKGGDALLLKAILEHNPDVVGFALYTWNSTRTVKLARRLKAVAPKISTLGGGPEVNHDSPFIVEETAFDLLVFGEGEQTFAELIQALVLRFTLYDLKINGLFNHRQMKSSYQVKPRVALNDVNFVPSPYLTGALAQHESKFMMLELSRWCPSKCTFCYYGRQDIPLGGKRYFEVSRIKAELEWAMTRGVEAVHFVEANFNTLPHLPQIYQIIKETGANRQINFYAEMRGEAIDPAEADRLADCNFSTVEVGLQSAVPEVLAKVRRKNHLPRLVRGVHLLRERGIEVFLDAILGLPGDTPDTFRRTLDFIEQNDLAPYDLFHLQILSGTQLKSEVMAGQHGMIWQTEPPYFVLKTAGLSFEQLGQLRRETLARKDDDPHEVQGLPQPNPYSLTKTDGTKPLSPNSSPLERVIIELDRDFDKTELSNLAENLANEVTVWLKLGEVNDQKLARASEILRILSKPNPNGVWFIFIESETALPFNALQRLYGVVVHETGYLDNLAVFAFGEIDPNKFPFLPSIRLWNLAGYFNPNFQSPHKGISYIKRVELVEGKTVAQWRETLRQALVEGDMYLCIPPATALAKIMAILEGLEIGEARLWFEDWAAVAGLYNDPSGLSFPITWQYEISGLSETDLAKAALRWQVSRKAIYSSLI